MLYCLNPHCPSPSNPAHNIHCQSCGAPLALRNRFKALRPLGKGGFGTTYLAQDLDNRNKHCVIKRFSYQGSSAQTTAKAKQLFEQEAERLDHLIHPQIPRLLAYFQEDSHLYLVQEFIEGQTLQAELAHSGPFDEAQIRAVLHGLLPILQFVHSRSVIHRDLKPDNIMRRKTGELILIDFGVAKLLKQSNHKTGTTIGTPGFAAPEQTYGRVTAASDIFALGATCFELLTQAFSADETPMVGYGWAERWQQFVKQSISDELAAVISRMVALEERSRYSTAAAVLSDLTSSQSAKPHASPNDAAQALLSNIPAVSIAASPPRALSTVISAPPISPTPVEPPLKGKIQKVSVSRIFWLKYSLLSYIGQALGFFTSMLCAALYALQFYENPQEDMDRVLRLMWLMYWGFGGTVVGAAQWVALRRWLRRAAWWIPTTIGGFWLIAIALLTFGTLSLLGCIVLGASASALQWLALKKHTPRAHWWILWTMGMAIMLFQVMSTSANRYEAILVWGAIWPVLDGCFLTWILSRRRSPATQLTEA